MRSSTLYNIITLVFLLLSIIVTVVVLLMAAQVVPVPSTFAPQPPGPTATMYVPPTFTPSITPTDTTIPTWTPSPTPEPPTATSTREPTATPTDEPTLDPFGQAPTDEGPIEGVDLPSPTPEILNGDGPVVEGMDERWFTLEGERVLYQNNYVNELGCEWQGIGGRIVDATGIAIQDVRVRVTGDSIEEALLEPGQRDLYGESGWELKLADAATSQTVYVQLLGLNGEYLSDAVEVNMPGSCDTTLAIINFVEATGAAPVTGGESGELAIQPVNSPDFVLRGDSVSYETLRVLAAGEDEPAESCESQEVTVFITASGPMTQSIQLNVFAPDGSVQTFNVGGPEWTAAAESDQPNTWIIPLAEGLARETYTLQLVDALMGTPLSNPIEVTFPGNCEGNHAYFYLDPREEAYERWVQ